MFVALVVGGASAGVAVVVVLWSYSPLLAILGIPMVASLVTAIFALSRVLPRRTRHGLRYRDGLPTSANALRSPTARV
jgi:hypothetical protein